MTLFKLQMCINNRVRKARSWIFTSTFAEKTACGGASTIAAYGHSFHFEDCTRLLFTFAIRRISSGHFRLDCASPIHLINSHRTTAIHPTAPFLMPAFRSKTNRKLARNHLCTLYKTKRNCDIYPAWQALRTELIRSNHKTFHFFDVKVTSR